jgi:hypothetical protein
MALKLPGPDHPVNALFSLAFEAIGRIQWIIPPREGDEP